MLARESAFSIPWRSIQIKECAASRLEVKATSPASLCSRISTPQHSTQIQKGGVGDNASVGLRPLLSVTLTSGVSVCLHLFVSTARTDAGLARLTGSAPQGTQRAVRKRL